MKYFTLSLFATALFACVALAQKPVAAVPAPVVPAEIQKDYYKAMLEYQGLASALQQARAAVVAQQDKANAACGTGFQLDLAKLQQGDIVCVAVPAKKEEKK